MPQIKTTVLVVAPIDVVMRVARDYAAYPSFMKDVKSVDVLEDDGSRIVAKWIARVEEVKMEIKWTQEDVWDFANRTSRFRQTSGDYDRMEGDWYFAEENGGTRFDSVVDAEFTIPLVGALLKNLIARKVQENLQAMQDAIKAQAEKVARN